MTNTGHSPCGDGGPDARFGSQKSLSLLYSRLMTNFYMSTIHGYRHDALLRTADPLLRLVAYLLSISATLAYCY